VPVPHAAVAADRDPLAGRAQLLLARAFLLAALEALRRLLVRSGHLPVLGDVFHAMGIGPLAGSLASALVSELIIDLLVERVG
jgi:hypothetical protein